MRCHAESVDIFDILGENGIFQPKTDQIGPKMDVCKAALRI